ncbi:MAG TPA: hypothetical protein V6D06_20420 [Trichocoleus sp.]
MNGYTHYPNQDRFNRQASAESLRPSIAKPEVSGLAAALRKAGGAVVDFLTNGSSLRVWTRQRNGHMIWHVYDPMTERRQQFSSEAELRSWLENRYYE